ncbi:MAG: radical SAM protein [Candidatus Kuenenia sp.]|nr:radical SAM protein [Candidatus Kuenenia hertensis]
MEKPLPDNLSEFLTRTGNLLIHLLDKCNLHCKHCYLDASSHGKCVLPLDLVKRTMDEADDLGINSLQFSGGEPFLYPYIQEVLCAAKGRKFNVVLSTNGTCIDDRAADLLADINASVVTSIDGPSDYHDMFRGKKSCFSKAEAGIARLVDRGVNVRIVTTVCADSIRYVEWCAEWANKMGASVMQFQPLEGIGRGNDIRNKRLSAECLHDLFIQLSDLAAFYASRGLQIKMTYQSRDYMVAHPCAAFVCNGADCHRGVEKELKKIVVREDGTILPELVDIDRQFSIGNLYKDTLKNNLLIYLNEKYSFFDQLCRYVYNDAIHNYPSPLIPWNEILTEKSKVFNQLMVKKEGRVNKELNLKTACCSET